jgi:integrase
MERDMPSRQLTDVMVAKLPVRDVRYTHADTQLPGHYVRVQPSGSKTYAVIMRDPRGKQVLHTIGSATLHTIAEARELARDAIKAIKAGKDRQGPQSFAAVAEEWFKRHVEAKGLRSKSEIRRYLDKHILPEWGGRDFESIRRSDVAKLLDKIEDGAGAVSADLVLSTVRGIFNWYATRHDNYSSPIVKGMRRSSPKERARKRVLSDDEIRAVWQAASENGTFGAFMRVLLLTAQRREKVAAMRWQDVSVEGVWTIPTEAREKGTANELPLPEAALAIIKAQPRYESNPYVFAGRGGTHCSAYSKGKATLDAKLKVASWRLHDLRRTARSLMARAGVRPDIAERVLGHAIQGVEGVYDRHSYREEKAHALKALAGLIENILRPESARVRQLRG